tara:strand:- start:3947 stop:4552 length:606 start_codon:yes stop_codon:yes gene_type:complete
MIEFVNIDLSLLIDFLRTTKGVLAFSIIYILSIICLLPGSWVSLLAGFIYGYINATIIVFIAAFLGAHITFFLSRTFLKDFINKKLLNYPRLNTIKDNFSYYGIKLIFLTRLSPLFPFSLLNYLYGLTSVRLRDYSIGLIAILPGTILYTLMGSLALDISQISKNDEYSLFGLVIKLVGIISTGISVYLLGFKTKAKFNFD